MEIALLQAAPDVCPSTGSESAVDDVVAAVLHRLRGCPQAEGSCGVPPFCSGRGACIAGASAAEDACACEPWFTGADCDTCVAGHAGPDCAECAEGFHLEHRNGALGPLVEIADPLEASGAGPGRQQPAPLEHRCVADRGCEGVSCSGHGVCEEDDGVPQCACEPAYAGARCENCAPGHERSPQDTCVRGESCHQQVCSGYGRCVSDGGEIACACDPGLAGERCTHCAPGFHGEGDECVADESCSEDTCAGNGACEVVAGVVVCACAPGFFGPDCSRTCIGNTCSGRGTCGLVDGLPACSCGGNFDPRTDCATCRPGYDESGPALCLLEDSCTPSSCDGHGACRTSAVGIVCICDGGYRGTTCDDCARGFVRFGETCLPEESCDQLACSGRGACEIAGGEAACFCDEGFFGASCELENPPTLVRLLGAETSIAFGDTVELTAELFGIGNFGRGLAWSLVRGEGRVVATENGARYESPSAGGPFAVAVIEARPTCCPGPSWRTVVKMQAAEELAVPIQQGNGANDEHFAPLDRALTDLVRARCAGAATVAVARFGTEVYRAGYGRLSGAPVDDPSWESRCGVDPFAPPSAVTDPSTPMRLAGNSKALTAALAREAGRRRWVQRFGSQPTPAQVESMRVCDPAPDLLPARLFGVLCGGEAVPVPHSGAPPPQSCGDCANASACSQELDYDGAAGAYEVTETLCACPTGFAGERCLLCPEAQASPPRADARWQQVTLGHLLHHRAGLGPGELEYGRDIVPHLPLLRGLESAADFEADEARLAGGDGIAESALEAARADLQLVRGLGSDPSRRAFFLAAATPEEILLVQAGLCLRRDPGAYGYSNLGYAFLQAVIEHVYARRFAALVGRPELFAGSALEEFLAAELGIDGGTRSPWGIYDSQVVFDRRHGLEPLWRHYGTGFLGFGRYYPQIWDEKRPDCVFAAGACDFSAWLEAAGGVLPRYAWLLDPPEPETQLQAGYVGAGVVTAAGALAAEHPLWLRFMKGYWISGDRGASTYGSTRVAANGVSKWGIFRQHQGRSPTSAASWQLQLADTAVAGVDCAADPDCVPGERCLLEPLSQTMKCAVPTYWIPALDEQGRIAADAADADLVPHLCHLPDGVDVIVSLNQANDRVCEQEEEREQPGYTCETVYGSRFRDYVLHGICRVDWSAVQALPLAMTQ